VFGRVVNPVVDHKGRAGCWLALVKQ
jgi:hypothetical protein